MPGLSPGKTLIDTYRPKPKKLKPHTWVKVIAFDCCTQCHLSRRQVRSGEWIIHRDNANQEKSTVREMPDCQGKIPSGH